MSETQKGKQRAVRGPNERQIALARGVLQEGKTFQASALSAGYSPNVAKQGLKFMRKDCPGIDKAFIAVSQEQTYKPNELKSMALNRLVTDISRGKSSGLEKSIDLLARFKEHDWLVRNADVQIGVFAALGEAGPVIDAVAEVIPEE